VPLEASSYRVGTDSGWQETAFHGAFDIDAATGELLRPMSETAELPDVVPACRYRTAANYHEVLIGGGQYLLPLDSAWRIRRSTFRVAGFAAPIKVEATTWLKHHTLLDLFRRQAEASRGNPAGAARYWSLLSQGTGWNSLFAGNSRPFAAAARDDIPLNAARRRGQKAGAAVAAGESGPAELPAGFHR